MDARFTYTAASLPAAQDWARAQAAGWGISPVHVGRWLRRGAELLDARTGEVLLSYDATDRLLSLDVYCEGALVFGMDDLL